MKIKRLDITGFKSFVDKVTLDFEPGITGIVGPNGCGKSNILDAVRWVMGEQNVRLLRGRNMEDVIFGGSETRKPTSLAQVSLVLDNSDRNCPEAYRDYAEIMVTRKLYRSGDSEYLINKTPCRLLDINELFMDTGVGARAYSIIEQGKVGALVSARPEERRVLIEEAAGVTKFKSRKKSALKKMDATRQNLVRLGDVIAEVRRQLGSLQRQAQKAEQFRDLRREARRIELCLSGNRLLRLDQALELSRRQEGQFSDNLVTLDAQVTQGEVRLETLQLELAEAESRYHQAQQKEYQLAADVQRLESERNLIVRQREEHLAQQQQAEIDLQQCEGRLTELAAEADELTRSQQAGRQELEALKEQSADGEKELEGLRNQVKQENDKFERCRREVMEQLSLAGRLQSRADELERRLAGEKKRAEQLTQERDQIRERQAAMGDLDRELASRHDRIEAEKEEIAQRLDALEEERTVRKNSLARQQQRLDEQREQLGQASSRYESLTELQRNREGYGEGARTLLAAQAGRRILAEMVRVDAAAEIAVEAVLGERLQGISLTSLEELKDSLALLRSEGVRGHLLFQRQPGPALDYPAGTPLSKRVVSVAEAQPLLDQLLAGVFLVEDVTDHLQVELAPGMLLVDSCGQCLDWRGWVGGGHGGSEDAGLLRRQRQLEELTGQIETLRQKVADERAVLEQQQQLFAEVEEMQGCAQSAAHRAALQLLEWEKDRQAAATEGAQLERRLSLLDFELDQLREHEAALRDEHQQCLADREQAVFLQQDKEQAAQRLQQELDGLRQTLDDRQDSLTRQRIALAALEQQQTGTTQTLQRIARERDETATRRDLLRRRIAEGDTAQQEFGQRDQDLRTDIDEHLQQYTAQQLQGRSLQATYQQQRDQLETFREKQRQVRTVAEEQRKDLARLQLQQKELQLEAEHLLLSVEERFAVDLRVQQVPEATDSELERQRQQLQGLQQKITALGDVNLMAIEEFEELEKRYDFLIQQRDDLKQSLDDLEKAIAQINRTTRRRFKETFEQANAMFQQVFPRLFRGGQAELRLTDESDLLETGVEIIVQPPGKRLQNVNLLSGGEKALTAVALIFSLFLLKPTPFCVLDEVDAPLDDANIDRFAEMVREMTDRSQFILITHSKRTMSIVDTLYGVTMQEAGVSRLVSVRMNVFGDAPEPVAG